MQRGLQLARCSVTRDESTLMVQRRKWTQIGGAANPGLWLDSLASGGAESVAARVSWSRELGGVAPNDSQCVRGGTVRTAKVNTEVGVVGSSDLLRPSHSEGNSGSGPDPPDLSNWFGLPLLLV